MKLILKEAILKNLWFYILTTISIGFLIASFIVPPLGAINPTVLEAVGEIFAFASLGTVIKAIDKGVDAKVKKGDTELSIGDFNKEDKEEDDEVFYPTRTNSKYNSQEE